MQFLKNSITQKHLKLFLFFSFCSFICVFFIDYPLIAWLFQNDFLIIKNTFEYLTLLGDARFAFLVFLLLLFFSWLFPFFFFVNISKKFYCKKILLQQAKTLLLFLLLGGLVVRFFKILVGRYRPSFFLETGIKGFDSFRLEYQFTSFPSGHTQTVTTLMLCLAFFYPKYQFFFYLFLFLGAVSRVVILAHYPSDVLMGFYIGLVCAHFAQQYYQKRITNLCF